MSNKVKKLVLVVSCLFLLVFLTACGKSSNGTPAPQQPQQQEEIKPIKIGVLGALQLTAGKEIENRSEERRVG